MTRVNVPVTVNGTEDEIAQRQSVLAKLFPEDVGGGGRENPRAMGVASE